ncbi:M24 family metallopeptidase [Tumidithrix elongata RA019]|uniref:M24 family metallopeptidase n=1 Tax=Tumidithrix elongata BACA0141 TaxID=2716417 RepID=A0AAW9PPL8_9CYAN|nr:M24 family metallopeptidase [Tumidithrix elongata RA019]
MLLSDLLPPNSSPTSNQHSPYIRLTDLRSLLRERELDGYFIPSADEHLNEYLPEAKQRRQWASGFTGSAGDFLVSQDAAWLFVDSRYHEQAELQVDPNFIKISKLGLEGHKTTLEILEEFGDRALKQQTSFRLGFDPFTLTVDQFRQMKHHLDAAGVDLVPTKINLIDQLRAQSPWREIDPVPDYGNSLVFSLSDTLTGETVSKKLERVRESMQKSRTAILPVTKLDQIAWLFNLRGQDVDCNPVFIAYAIVTTSETYLFTNQARIDEAVKRSLTEQVTILDYEQYLPTLERLVATASSNRVLVATAQTTLGTYLKLKEHKAKIVEAKNPIEVLKALKNAVEIEQMQQANLKASRAKTLTLKWISEQFAAGNAMSELDVVGAIEGFYHQTTGFQELSFPTIAATGANSSIVHYSTPSHAHQLKSGDLFLLDSGSQFLAGTTDDTRTIAIGEPTAEQIERYTEVLRSHINCAMQRFPKGTTGSQIDGIARSSLWSKGLDFGHGTGHGVGVFLNVHEGPNGISKRVQTELEAGMVTSIEPGFYQSGWGGIRIENLYVVREIPKSENSVEGSSENSQTDAQTDAKKKVETPPWFEFESLTYIPFDKRLIDRDRLNTKQQEWLNRYHEAVIAKLSPMLDAEQMAWLETACRF